MERESVVKILKFYNDIEGHISFARKKLSDYDEEFYGLHSPNLSGLPSKTNRVSNPTESTALNIPDSVSKQISALETEIQALYSLQAAILTEVCKLPLVEKQILTFFYINHLQWVQISIRAHYSETQCKKIRNRGLDKLGTFFEKNNLIKNFNYPP